MENYFETLNNPFKINIEDKLDYTIDEMISIQNKVKDKKEVISSLIKKIYPKNKQFNTSFEFIHKRCDKTTQILVDVSNNILPSKRLWKIGNGGDGKNCIVCCTIINDSRFNASQNIKESLENVGFNGHFYLFNGGFPNPSGIEMKFVCVPYCFKIFMMLEAQKLGFEKVIWIDSACYAVNNPQKLFDVLNKDHILFRTFPPGLFEPDDHTVFPETIELLNNITNKDIRNDENICSIVFGLNFNYFLIDDFVSEYYEMVELGLPFLSYFPEEVVYASIFNKPRYKMLINNRTKHINDRLFMHECYNTVEQAKNNGYYFLQRKYV
jgi:hypothetical protein